MKVYVVTSGRYDDYTIDGVFSTERIAQFFIDEGKCTFNAGIHIEVWDVDELIERDSSGTVLHTK